MPLTAVVKPVPVPFKMPVRVVVTVRVPDVITGLLETVNPLGMERPTEVTVPLLVVGACDSQVVPFEVRTLPDVPGATLAIGATPLPSRT